MRVLGGERPAVILIDEVGDEADDVVRDLLRAANEPFRARLAPAAYDPYLAMVLDLDGRRGVSSVLLAEERGRPVGTVTFFPDARDEGWGGPAGVAGIRSMAVHPDAQGRGVGAALLEECLRRARDVGATAIALHTAEWLPAAVRLYERHGFVRDAAHDRTASELMGVPRASDFTALAYRLQLAR